MPFSKKTLVITIITALIVTLFLKLSIWQRHRYHYKKSLEVSFAQEVSAPPKDLETILKVIQANAYYKIKLTGNYDNRQFLLDNRINTHHQVGVSVITPFHLNQGGTILVNRGFLALDKNHHLRVPIAPPQNTITITGLIMIPAWSFVLGPIIEPQKIPTWPKWIMRVDPKAASEALQEPLLPYMVFLDKAAPDGFEREWQPPNFGAARSLAYSFQWIALAILAIILYWIIIKT